jgi:hypothetical protein
MHAITTVYKQDHAALLQRARAARHNGGDHARLLAQAANLRFYFERYAVLTEPAPAPAPCVPLFHVVSIHEKSGKVTLCTSTPMNHHSACVNLSKFTYHPHRRMQLQQVVGEFPENPPQFDLTRIIANMELEILADMKSGRVPATVASFDELHNYVDANCYGSFADDDFINSAIAYFGGRDSEEGWPHGLANLVSASQGSIHFWLKERAAAQLAARTA